MDAEESSGTRAPGPPTGAPALVVGATGFVGRHLCAALAAAGVPVRAGSRDPRAARARHPPWEWVACDVDDPATLAGALAGCGCAYYLVHQMSGPGYERRELRAAAAFAEAAAAAGLERIVYLGGIAPAGGSSPHLASRLETGRILRAGAVPTLELRASVIVGAGSASWRILRDLAARLPAMVLPRWLGSRTEPIALDDVVAALVAARTLPLEGSSACFDLPGPEVLTAREMLRRTAALLGRRPALVAVPFLTPRLSTLWVTAIARGDHYLAAQLVESLRTGDLLARDDAYWRRIGHERRVPFDDAARATLAAEAGTLGPGGRLLERVARALTPRARGGR
jgi:uncharacterized protein YbjT (DUF2867 family)